jgi:hypothetical protein
MRKRVGINDLTEPEKTALATLLKSIADAEEFRARTAEQNVSVEARIERRHNETPEQRNDRARRWIETVDAGSRTGVLHDPELFLLRVFAVEQVHEDRMIDGSYGAAFADIQNRMDQVRAHHGLDDDEFWYLGEGPPEWESLCSEYDTIYERLFVATLGEFGLLEEVRLRETDPKEFDRRRELGRRAIHKGLTDIERLQMIQGQFEREASVSAIAGAFHAAATMIGAAIETALMARCLRHPDEAFRARAQLPNRERPKSGDPREWSFNHLTKVAEAASWLPEFHTHGAALSADRLIHMVRGLRNMVHPGAHLRSVLTNRVVRGQYEDAQAIYELLRRHVAT